MKILIDTYNTATQNTSGGVQIRIKEYVEELRKRGYDVTLYNKWIHKVTDFDILHIFKASFDSYSLINYAKSKGIPVVLSSIIPLKDKNKIILSNIMEHFHIHMAYTFIKKEIAVADAVIVETQDEKQFITRYYGVNNIFVIPNGVTINFDNTKVDEFYNRTGIKDEFVLQVGRFDSNKNQLNVIRAMRNSNIPVVFIGGESSDEPNYFKKCNEEATENIHILGWIKHNDSILVDAYKNAKVVILPSYKETFGMALIEGGAAGANLIATKGLPILDWGVKEICETINPNDIEKIRLKINEAYNKSKNPLTSKKIYELFSWDKVIGKHIDIYNSVLKG